jgi:hypothetical protein
VVIGFSETSISIHRNTWCYIPKDNHLANVLKNEVLNERSDTAVEKEEGR